jgi:hypothetical protein
VLEVGELGDRGGDDLAGELVPDQSGQPGKPRMPVSYGFGEGFHISVLSEMALVFHLFENAQRLGSIRGDATGGVNTFIREQDRQPGEALLTLVQFDDKYEC